MDFLIVGFRPELCLVAVGLSLIKGLIKHLNRYKILILPSLYLEFY